MRFDLREANLVRTFSSECRNWVVEHDSLTTIPAISSRARKLGLARPRSSLACLCTGSHYSPIGTLFTRSVRLSDRSTFFDMSKKIYDLFIMETISQLCSTTGDLRYDGPLNTYDLLRSNHGHSIIQFAINRKGTPCE